MPLNDPARRGLRNISKQPAKVSVVIPPGDELEVSAEVADQLEAASPALKPLGFERTTAEPTSFEAVPEEAVEPAEAPPATKSARKRAPRPKA